jgi:hypothetical protein
MEMMISFGFTTSCLLWMTPDNRAAMVLSGDAIVSANNVKAAPRTHAPWESFIVTEEAEWILSSLRMLECDESFQKI